ncbi:hypothetical protein B0T20DRAFT_405366 [Sordaria brevicollis]|uniref:Uncharacterized protein n=1 Tax=Sordaria brevicollis TaxID=83679 RepID=A0AAE0PJA5_SORBR|nr:hypothetical protein B0T20DRAFT_405366 [Sordaria brevicollis]
MRRPVGSWAMRKARRRVSLVVSSLSLSLALLALSLAGSMAAELSLSSLGTTKVSSKQRALTPCAADADAVCRSLAALLADISVCTGVGWVC